MPATVPRCLIIGATGGVGRALVERLSARGWPLVLAARTTKPLVALAEEHAAEALVFDAREALPLEKLFAEQPGISAAVNLAGSILLKPAHMTFDEEFEETLSLNLRTAFSLVRAAGRAMRERGGSVVLMSSCAATVGLPNHEAISAAKAGVEGLVRAAAATYASARIRFNAVAPGLVDTPMAARITSNDAALRASVAMHPLGRIGSPEDVARMIEFLLDPANDWITGKVVGVDGGLSTLRSR
jgi:NAD(P)-dependent dehydrogenase (short-subunit alcohol dehydrogenase family)